MNAIQNVESAMDISGIHVPHKKQYAFNILKELGLSEEESKRDIRKLSGGQQQRIAIARAMAKDVDLILCDEPTGNLDQETSQGIIQTFIQLAHDKNKCVIVVTHSKDFAKELDVQLQINQGKLERIESVFTENHIKIVCISVLRKTHNTNYRRPLSLNINSSIIQKERFPTFFFLFL